MKDEEKKAISKQCLFRDITLFDMTAIVAIEASVSENPWGSSLLIREINKKGFIGLCALSPDGTVLGYAMGQKTENEFEFRKIAVASKFQNCGIGVKLARKVLSHLRTDISITVFLEVAGSNAPAQNVYKKLGFKTVSVRKKYYNNREDALIMSKTLKSIKGK